LRIVKQFIEELEGEIEVDSELNRGTTFICYVPLRLPLLVSHPQANSEFQP